MRVLVVGASQDREKYGNRAVRAYRRLGHEVLPVNPNLDEVEGLPCYRSISDAPGPIDRATVYVPPTVGVGVVKELAARGDVSEVWLNPGAESPEVVGEARRLGLSAIVACSIVDIGVSPYSV